MQKSLYHIALNQFCFKTGLHYIIKNNFIMLNDIVTICISAWMYACGEIYRAVGKNLSKAP